MGLVKSGNELEARGDTVSVEKDPEGMQSLKMIARGGGLYFFGLITSKILAYVYRIFIAQYFGPADYGVFSMGLALIGFFEAVALLGLSRGVIRYIAFYSQKKEEAKLRGVISSSVRLAMPLSFILLATMLAFSPLLSEAVFSNAQLGIVLAVLSFSLPFTVTFLLINSFFIGFKRMDYQIYSEVLTANSMRLLFILLFGMLGLGLAGLSLAWTMAAVVTAVISVFMLRRIFPFRSMIKSLPMKKELLLFSFPLLFTNFMLLITTYTDTLMIGIFKAAEDVGIYNAAVPTARLLTMFPYALNALFLPVITSLYALKKEDDLAGVYRTVSKWLLYLNAPLLFAFIFFPRQIITLIFGPMYAEGYSAMLFLTIGFFISGFSILSFNLLNMYKKTKYILYVTIVNTLVNVVLNLALIPVFGIDGAAFASMTMYAVSFCLYQALIFRMTGIRQISRSFVKTAVLAAVAFISVYGIFMALIPEQGIPLIIAFSLLALLFYMLLVSYFRALSREDIEMLKTIERKSNMKLSLIRRLLKKVIR
ncbi:MAG: flippase [Candidatus Aenigmarchaeota archaeon]|nr:flippase [Candidatus Aenigmarchaeota archaeon]